MELILMSISQYADDFTLIIGLRYVVMPFTATHYVYSISMYSIKSKRGRYASGPCRYRS